MDGTWGTSRERAQSQIDFGIVMPLWTSFFWRELLITTLLLLTLLFPVVPFKVALRPLRPFLPGLLWAEP